MPSLTASDWVTIVTCICSSGTASVVANHVSAAIMDKKRFEDTPSVQARNTISRHSAFCMLKSIHSDSVRRGYIPLEELDEAQEIYDAYHTLGGNGAGSRIIHDLQSMNNYPPTQSE